MITLYKEESARLITFSKDSVVVEALKKLFLNCFIRGKASALDIELLDKAFKDLEHLQEKENTRQETGQIAL